MAKILGNAITMNQSNILKLTSFVSFVCLNYVLLFVIRQIVFFFNSHLEFVGRVKIWFEPQSLTF